METVKVLIISLALMVSVFSLQLQRVFKKKPLLDDQFCSANATIVFNATQNILKCASQCDQDPLCHSFFYRKSTSKCKGVNAILTNSNGCDTLIGSRYYTADKRIGSTCTSDLECPIQDTVCDTDNGVCDCGPGLVPNVNNTACDVGTTSYGEACFNTSDCYGTNISCYNGSCMCNRGLIKDSKTKTCHDTCSVYADTFTTFVGATIIFPNSTVWQNHTIPECITACLNTGCTTMRYAHEHFECKTDATTVVGATTVDVPTVTLFMRDCLIL